MGEVSVTAIDVVAVAIVLISAVLAAWRGLVGETFRIVDWVAAAFVAIRFTPTFQPLLRETISPAWLEYIVVFIGTFLVMFVPLSMMNYRIAEAVRKSEIGPVDRVLGFLFGAARGVVIVGVAYIIYAMFVPVTQHPQSLTRAHTYPVIRQTAEMLLDVVPGRQDVAGLDSDGPASRPPPQRGATAPPADAAAYGANDRSALDKLFETSGGQQGPSQ
jgi:membrane protein required for colicin V production